MKRLGIVLALVALVGIAFAAGPTKQSTRWNFLGGLSIGATDDTASNRVANRMGGASTIDFASTSTGVVFSSGITKTGATVGDICKVSAPAAASALNATFSCVVTATDTVKVLFEPKDRVRGVMNLTSASPSIAITTVPAGSVCTCAPQGATAAVAAAGCANTVTLDAGISLLTLTGPNTVTTTMTYDCAAPVDPASGSYAFELTRNGS